MASTMAALVAEARAEPPAGPVAPSTADASTPEGAPPSLDEALASDEARASPAERNSGLGYALAGGIAYGHLDVDLGSKQRTNGVGLFVHAGASLFSGNLSARARLSGVFGGGSGSAEKAYSGEAWLGVGHVFGGMSQIFVRAGAEGYAFKNDELEASTGSVPALQVGYQLWGDAVGFEVAPRIGMTARSEYEPGDEAAGRRHWRRLGLRASYGGGAMLTSKFFFLDGSLLRVADSEPLTVVDGRACVVALFVALCGHGQYWRSAAAPGGSPVNVGTFSSFYLGGAIGIAFAGSGDDGPFRTKKPAKKPPRSDRHGDDRESEDGGKR